MTTTKITLDGENGIRVDVSEENGKLLFNAYNDDFSAIGDASFYLTKKDLDDMLNLL